MTGDLTPPRAVAYPPSRRHAPLQPPATRLAPPPAQRGRFLPKPRLATGAPGGSRRSRPGRRWLLTSQLRRPSRCTRCRCSATRVTATAAVPGPSWRGWKTASYSTPPSAAASPFGSRITYSFVPDGTNIGGDSSALFSSMAAKGITAAQWQGAIESAAATWEAAANINLVLVPDDGSAFGVGGGPAGRLAIRRHPHRRRLARLGDAGHLLPAPARKRRHARRRHRLQRQPALVDRQLLRRPDRRHPRVGPRPGPGPLGVLHGRHVRHVQRREANSGGRRHLGHPGRLARATARLLRDELRGGRLLQPGSRPHLAAQLQRPGDDHVARRSNADTHYFAVTCAGEHQWHPHGDDAVVQPQLVDPQGGGLQLGPEGPGAGRRKRPRRLVGDGHRHRRGGGPEVLHQNARPPGGIDGRWCLRPCS